MLDGDAGTLTGCTTRLREAPSAKVGIRYVAHRRDRRTDCAGYGLAATVVDVQVLPASRSSLVYMALVTLLAAGLAIGVALFVLQTRVPNTDARFVVAAPEAVDCPVGTGKPVCYRYDVTNAGSGTAPVRCVIVPPASGSAVFTASGTTVYDSPGPVAAGEVYSLYAEVEADETAEVTRPTMGCAPVG